MYHSGCRRVSVTLTPIFGDRKLLLQVEAKMIELHVRDQLRVVNHGQSIERMRSFPIAWELTNPLTLRS